MLAYADVLSSEYKVFSMWEDFSSFVPIYYQNGFTNISGAQYSTHNCFPKFEKVNYNEKKPSNSIITQKQYTKIKFLIKNILELDNVLLVSSASPLNTTSSLSYLNIIEKGKPLQEYIENYSSVKELIGISHFRIYFTEYDMIKFCAVQKVFTEIDYSVSLAEKAFITKVSRSYFVDLALK